VTTARNVVIVDFNQYMLATTSGSAVWTNSALNSTNFLLSSGASFASEIAGWKTNATFRVQPSGNLLGKTVAIEMSGTNLTAAQQYTLRMNNLKDLNGNATAPANYDVTFTAQQEFKDVVFILQGLLG